MRKKLKFSNQVKRKRVIEQWNLKPPLACNLCRSFFPEEPIGRTTRWRHVVSKRPKFVTLLSLSQAKGSYRTTFIEKKN
jgi:hypothetical protein